MLKLLYATSPSKRIRNHQKIFIFEKVTNQNVTLANRKIPEFPWISTRICQGYRQVLFKHSFANDFAIFSVNHSLWNFFIVVDLIQTPQDCVRGCIINFFIAKKNIFPRFRFFLRKFSLFEILVRQKHDQIKDFLT